eukprot:7609208-Prorocentrum_lima.AAC.1
MTSSLVGSEMCIRDRKRIGFGGNGGERRTRECVEVCKWREGGKSPVSVSYTHLTLPTICSV